MTTLSEESNITVEDIKVENSNHAIKMEDELFKPDTLHTNIDEPSDIAIKMEEDPSNIGIKMEEEPSDIAIKMEEKPSDIAIKTEDEPSDVATKTEDEPSDKAIKMEEEPSDVAIKTEEPSNIAIKTEDEPSDIATKTEGEIIEPCTVKKEPAGFLATNFEIKTNPDEIDFMIGLKGDEPSDLEFSEDSDSSSDIEIDVGDKEVKADVYSTEDPEFCVVDLLPKTTVNELDENKIEELLASRIMPTKLNFKDRIASLGKVKAISGPCAIIIESNVLAKRNSPILDEDTLLVLKDRTIVGTIFETFGPVSRPLYLVRFPKPTFVKEKSPLEDIASNDEPSVDDTTNLPFVIGPSSEGPLMPSSKYQVGQEIFYAEGAARVVPVTEILKQKGTDASNQNDEEIDSDEMEFSDDEKEQAHKLRKKNKLRFSNIKKTSNVPSTTSSSTRKRNRPKASQKIIDEDNPNKGLTYDQASAIPKYDGDDYTRLLMSYDDL